MKNIIPLLMKIPCPISELCLDITLQCGQSFRWQKLSDGRWHGVVNRQVWTLWQDVDCLYCVLHNPGKSRNEKNNELQKKDLNKQPTEYLLKNVLPESNSNKTDREKPKKKIKMEEKDFIKPVREINEKLCGNLIQTKQSIISSRLIEPESVKTYLDVESKIKSDEDKITESSLIQCRGSTPAVNIDSKIHCQYTDIINAYFRLNVNLESLYAGWSDRDPHFKCIASDFPGVRILDQPPVENVFSFICSSNNNISRISQLVEKLSLHFGDLLCEVDGKEWHAFPTVEQLCDSGVQEKLRKLGFGYRASYISQAARQVAAAGGEAWLSSLKSLPYEECYSQLLTLAGVGPKVSDCVCLMSMNQLSAVPVDTHVLQIAARDYNVAEARGVKSVTQRSYRAVADHFRNLYGDYAGWAHSVLFSADLKKFATPRQGNSPTPKKKAAKKKA